MKNKHKKTGFDKWFGSIMKSKRFKLGYYFWRAVIWIKDLLRGLG